MYKSFSTIKKFVCKVGFMKIIDDTGMGNKSLTNLTLYFIDEHIVLFTLCVNITEPMHLENKKLHMSRSLSEMSDNAFWKVLLLAIYNVSTKYCDLASVLLSMVILKP